LIDLKDAILSLPPNLRETFVLARFTPMTNDEIARHQGISTKTVEWRISRAVSICLQRLERERKSR
jgi:RNA polymerase sigma factor (sigma-70 family)